MNILLGPIQLNQSSPDVLVIMAVLHCGLRIHTWRLLLHLFSYFLPSVCGALEKSIRHGSIKTGHGRRIHVGKQKKYASYIYIYIIYIFFMIYSIDSIFTTEIPGACRLLSACAFLIFWSRVFGGARSTAINVRSTAINGRSTAINGRSTVCLRFVYGPAGLKQKR